MPSASDRVTSPNQIRAARAIMEQTIKQEATFQANFDKQEEAIRSSGGVDDSFLRDGRKRSAADHWDDLIRGVDTVDDPSTGGTAESPTWASIISPTASAITAPPMIPITHQKKRVKWAAP